MFFSKTSLPYKLSRIQLDFYEELSFGKRCMPIYFLCAGLIQVDKSKQITLADPFSLEDLAVFSFWDTRKIFFEGKVSENKYQNQVLNFVFNCLHSSSQNDFPEYNFWQDNFSLDSFLYVTGKSSSSFDLVWEINKSRSLPDWGAVMAVSQSQGRGQLRRHWISEPGNLYLSFKLPPEINGEAASVITGYLIALALNLLGVPVHLKWPNDILLENKKLGGILLEERNNILVAGLGLNLNLVPDSLLLRRERAFEATCLKDEGFGFSEESIIQVLPVCVYLLEAMKFCYEKFIKDQSRALILTEAEKVLAFKNKLVLLHDICEIQQTGIIKGLGKNGELRLLVGEQEILCHSGTILLTQAQ